MHDFPGRLDEFVRRTNGSLGSATEIILQRTILPFYPPFRSSTDEEAVEAMRGALGSIKYCLGILTSRIGLGKHVMPEVFVVSCRIGKEAGAFARSQKIAT